jgi:hypothetical protein
MATSERFLALVPAATCAQAGISGPAKWSSDYNVACWVRGRATTPTRLSLVLRFRDAAGEHQTLVDRAECRQDSAMLLAGKVTLVASGRIEVMDAWLLGEPSSDVQVDELYVQRAGAQVAEKPIQVAR